MKAKKKKETAAPKAPNPNFERVEFRRADGTIVRVPKKKQSAIKFVEPAAPAPVPLDKPAPAVEPPAAPPAGSSSSLAAPKSSGVGKSLALGAGVGLAALAVVGAIVFIARKRTHP